jgi:hypothetical protein
MAMKTRADAPRADREVTAFISLQRTQVTTPLRLLQKGTIMEGHCIKEKKAMLIERITRLLLEDKARVDTVRREIEKAWT